MKNLLSILALVGLMSVMSLTGCERETPTPIGNTDTSTETTTPPAGVEDTPATPDPDDNPGG